MCNLPHGLEQIRGCVDYVNMFRHNFINLTTVMDYGLLNSKVISLRFFSSDYDRLHFCPKDVQLK